MFFINITSLRKQYGQSMVEYIVVVFFSVMLLLAPLFDPSNGDSRYASIDGDTTFESFEYANPKVRTDLQKKMNSIEVVMAVMKDNYKGYSYAVSLSDYPDYKVIQQQQQVLSDITGSLQSAVDAKNDAIALVKNNIPPKLPTPSFPKPQFP